MRQDRKCSICGFVIHNNDKLYDQRKQKHEHHHLKNGASQNHSIGKVVWEAIW